MKTVVNLVLATAIVGASHVSAETPKSGPEIGKRIPDNLSVELVTQQKTRISNALE